MKKSVTIIFLAVGMSTLAYAGKSQTNSNQTPAQASAMAGETPQEASIIGDLINLGISAIGRNPAQAAVSGGKLFQHVWQKRSKGKKPQPVPAKESNK